MPRRALLIAAAATLSLVAPQAALARQHRTALSGTLVVAHSDDFRHGHAGYDYALRTGRRVVRLRFAGLGPHAGGFRIRVRGISKGATLRVARGGVRLLSRPASFNRRLLAAVGAHKVAVILFNFTNDTSQPWSPDQARGVMFTNPDSVNAYYQEQSFGKVSFTGKVRSDGDVFGWYTIPYTSSGCQYSTWASAAASQARAAGVDLTGYDHIVYAFPFTSSCGWAGLAETPGSRVWVSGSFTLRVLGHELGHNLGVHHASSLSCTDASGKRVPISSSCTQSEYGDPFDIMGSGSSRQTSNWHKGQYGWFAAANMKTVTASGTFTLAPEEAPSGAIQLLRVPRGSTGDYYYLEFRQPFGSYFDNFAGGDPAVNGVTIRLCPDYPSIVQSKLIDTTPSTTTFTDAPLAVAKTFDDAGYSISVTTKSVGPAGATVAVSLGGVAPPPPADTTPPSAPTLSASASSPTSATLSWTAATDDVGIAGYRIYRNGVQISTTSATSYADSGLSAATTYTYSVRAYDAAGNVSAGSNTASVTTPVPPDTTAPSAPAALSGRASGGTVSLSWSAATDDVGVVGYQLFRNGVQLATTTGTSFVDAAVVESATYTYTVRAYDVAGNVGPPSSALSVTTPAEEISRPVAPPAGGSPPPASDPPAGPQPPAQPPKPSAQEVSRLQRLLARWTARLRNSPALVHLARVLITR